MQRIYFDNAASTRPDPAVILSMRQVEKEYFGNPSSIHSFGQQSKAVIEKAREEVAGMINARARDIVFTSGGTESNNFALIGAALANRDKGNHIITTAIEHPSVLNAAKYLENIGFNITYLKYSREGSIDTEHINRLIDSQTILVSIMLVNNEVGSILPVAEISEKIKKKDVILHCDAVQALGKIDLNIDQLGVDLLSLSAHKIHGPKGVGGLYIKQGINIQSRIMGGAQEYNRRAGSENIVGIAGFATAIQQSIVNKSVRVYVKNLRDNFEHRLKIKISDIKINGLGTNRIDTISNIYFPDAAIDSMMINLDLEGLACSAGSACSSGVISTSHVLQAMNYDNDRAQKSIRFSFSRFNTQQEVNSAVDIIESVYNRLKGKNK